MGRRVYVLFSAVSSLRILAFKSRKIRSDAKMFELLCNSANFLKNKIMFRAVMLHEAYLIILSLPAYSQIHTADSQIHTVDFMLN